LLHLDPSDLVHVHVTQAFAPEIVWLASKFKRYQYLCHVHLDVPPSGPAGFLLRFYKPVVLRRVLGAAEFVLVFTEDQKREAIRRYRLEPGKVRVVPNGVENKFYFESPRVLPARPRLLFAGRLNYQKNLGQLLRALDGISDGFETTLVGEGELKSALMSLAGDLKLQNVNFAGRQDGEALLEYFRQADVFVLPSEREGMPLVLLEAMAMGLPIVATNVTGSKDVVRDGVNGLLVPYGDAAAMRAALLRITADRAQYARASRASSREAEHYTWDKVAAQFVRLYGAAQ
jgi:glycosyltransferase involved in cell wall biosynthesis